MRVSRREWLKTAGMTAAATVVARGAAGPISLFDGATLDGWLQIENNSTSLSSDKILNPAAFTAKLTNGEDAVSVYLRTRLQSWLAAPNPDLKASTSALVKALNAVIAGPSIYDISRFRGVVFQPEAAQLAARPSPTPDPSPMPSQRSARLNKLLIEAAYPDFLAPSPTAGWTVKDATMASTGSGRGVIYTAQDFTRFKLSFNMRHVSGNPDHQACVLIFCSRPKGDDMPLDALGGIQFQVPNGGHWDYRPGMNNAGGAEFTKLAQTKFDAREWSHIEITADASKGEAGMKVAQPVDSAPVDVLAFRDPAAGKTGPVAWQMHNAGLFDQYRDVEIEIG